MLGALHLAGTAQIDGLAEIQPATGNPQPEAAAGRQAEQDGGEDDQGQFDASFTLMMLTLNDFLPQLFEALGGEDIAQAV